MLTSVNQEGIRNYLEDKGENLDAFTKTIARVHGSDHPEIKTVAEEYFKIREKVNQGEDVLSIELENLKKLSGIFEAPAGTCEGTINTYEQYKELYKAGKTK